MDAVTLTQKLLRTQKWIQTNSKKQSNLLLPSVIKFAKFLQENTNARNDLHLGLSSIPQVVKLEAYSPKDVNPSSPPPRPGLLHGKTVQDFIIILNNIAQTPPKYENIFALGLPFASIIFDLAYTQGGRKFFQDKQANAHIIEIVNDYAEMLKSPKSLKYMNNEENGWFSAEALAKINYEEYQCDRYHPSYGFQCWNDWFTRAIKLTARPIDMDPDVIVNNSEHYPLTYKDYPLKNITYQNQFWLKDHCFSLDKIFQAQEYQTQKILQQSFVGGTFYQGFLTSLAYHRWHAPVSGVIERAYRIPGKFFHHNPYLDSKYEYNLVNSQPIIAAISTRQIYIIQADNPKIGRIGIVEIGMAEISGCKSLVKEGQHVQKGQLLGMFEFGGSSHALVFDKKANLIFNQSIYQRVYDPQSKIHNSTLQKVNAKLAQVI